MENLKYVINSKGDANFYFCSIKGSIGFVYWDDFLIIIDVINNYVFPKKSNILASQISLDIL